MVGRGRVEFDSLRSAATLIYVRFLRRRRIFLTKRWNGNYQHCFARRNIPPSPFLPRLPEQAPWPNAPAAARRVKARGGSMVGRKRHRASWWLLYRRFPCLFCIISAAIRRRMAFAAIGDVMLSGSRRQFASRPVVRPMCAASMHITGLAPASPGTVIRLSPRCGEARNATRVKWHAARGFVGGYFF